MINWLRNSLWTSHHSTMSRNSIIDKMMASTSPNGRKENWQLQSSLVMSSSAIKLASSTGFIWYWITAPFSQKLLSRECKVIRKLVWGLSATSKQSSMPSESSSQKLSKAIVDQCTTASKKFRKIMDWYANKRTPLLSLCPREPKPTALEYWTLRRI